MKKLVPSTPNAEVLGESILAYMNCLEQDQIVPILTKYGLVDVDAHAWYPLQKMLDVLRDIQNQPDNVSASMVSIGVKVMEIATLPPELNTVGAVLSALGAVYHLHHRNVTEEGWSAKEIGPGHMHIIHDSPYPADVAYGIVWSTVRRFRPRSTNFTVTRIENNDPDASEVYDVVWTVA